MNTIWVVEYSECPPEGPDGYQFFSTKEKAIEAAEKIVDHYNKVIDRVWKDGDPSKPKYYTKTHASLERREYENGGGYVIVAKERYE